MGYLSRIDTNDHSPGSQEKELLGEQSTVNQLRQSFHVRAGEAKKTKQKENKSLKVFSE